MKKVNPVKIYWEEFPENVDQFKNVLNPSKFQEPSKVLNSTEVMVQPKPWLKKDVNSSGVKPRTQNVYDDKKTAINKSFQKEPVINKSFQKEAAANPKNPRQLVSIKDLNPEDKQKIANLIRELAKFGNEKELAVKELSHVKENFNNLQRRLQSEKEMAVKEYDVLKQKLLEYEILVEEMKYKSLSDKSPPKVCSDITNMDAKSESSLIDNFSDLFLEQEKKFQQQQNVLQEQIEHLQRLQESVLQAQTVKNTLAVTTPKKIASQEPNCPNTKKLESYLQSSVTKDSQTENPITTNPMNLSIQSKPDRSITNRSTVDMEVQTEKHPTAIVVEDSYKNHQRIAGGSTKKVQKRYHDHSYTRDYDLHKHKSSLRNGQVKRTLYNKSSTQKSVGFSTKSPMSTFSQSSDESEEEDKVVVSPLRRKHFKPSSMLELVEGIQPRSASTSIDQCSLKQSCTSSSRTELNKRALSHSTRVGSKTATKSSISHGKVYQRTKPTTTRFKNERQQNEEMLEREILDEVFFM